MSLWEAIILGIVQGLTEFLPVSSSGHLELGKALFGLKDVDLTFSILVHGATACSTLVVFRKDIAKLIAGACTSDVAQRTSSHTYIFWLALSTLPAVTVAFTLRDFLEEAFLEHPHRVGWSLCATAFILYASERIARNVSRELTWSRVLGIGLAQALAIVPGISRSGSTIGAAVALGISREEAARFSFLMALPVIFGATALELKDVMEAGVGEQAFNGVAYAAGTVAAFVSGWAACQWMIRLVKRTNLKVFAVYCLVAGIAAILFI